MLGDVGFWSWLTQVDTATAADPVEDRSYSIGDPAIAFLLGYTTPGQPTISEYSALTLSAVWRAVSIISGSVASLPLRTLREDSDGLKTRVPSFLDTPGGDLLTPFEWRERVMVHLLLHGNAYLQHLYNGAGQLIALHPVHPSYVSTTWDASRPGGKLFRVGSTPESGWIGPLLDLDASSMTQIMAMSPDGLTGLSMITQARMSFGTGIQGDKAGYRTFANGALISGLVSPHGDEDLTEDEAKTVKSMVNRTMTGPENAGDLVVVNRKLDFTPWQMNAADAQFLQSREFQIDEVGRWFGVPPHLLGLVDKSTSWGQGIAEQNRGLARYTLTGWTGRIEQRMSHVLPATVTAEFDYSTFVRPSPEDEINLLVTQVNNGLLSPNEARAVRNLPPIPGGDTFRVSANTLATDAPKGAAA